MRCSTAATSVHHPRNNIPVAACQQQTQQTFAIRSISVNIVVLRFQYVKITRFLLFAFWVNVLCLFDPTIRTDLSPMWIFSLFTLQLTRKVNTGRAAFAVDLHGHFSSGKRLCSLFHCYAAEFYYPDVNFRSPFGTM